MKMFALAVLLASKIAEAQHSVSVCGSSGDHAHNPTATSSPDPVVAGQPFTLNFGGILDEDVTGGFLDLDLNIEALGLINKPVKANIDFNVNPGFVKGPFSVKIGPVNVPYIPGTNKLTGTLKIRDANKEPVFCVGLNLDLMRETGSLKSVADPISSCNSANSRIKNFAFSDVDGNLKATGDLDEDVTAFTIVAKTHVTLGWIPFPIDVSVPITYLPGFVKGPFELSASGIPVISMLEPEVGAAVGVDLAGQIKVNDGAGHELLCFNVDVPITDRVTNMTLAV